MIHDTDPLLDLLTEWEDARERGEPKTPEQLCVDTPELLGMLREQVHKLEAMSSVLNGPDTAGPNISQVETHRTAIAALRPQDILQETRIAPIEICSPFELPTAFCIPGYDSFTVLGRGGMGIVYKARQVALNRTVAIKMILAGAHASPAQLRRFDVEAKLIAQLRHPNIVQIYEMGHHDGFPYLVLEFADSGSLEGLLRRGPLDPKQTASFMESVAHAVEHAHQHGIIHRDLKPANILLQREVIKAPGTDSRSPLGGFLLTTTSQTDSGQPLQAVLVPKITDFGLARHLESGERLTQTGFAVGTPAYMAPEQARREDAAIGPGSDIFALGVILYQCLTGKRPFDAKTDWELMQSIVQSEPITPRSLRPDIPFDLQAICLRCLRKRPAERYLTAQSLADDLVEFLNDRPPIARGITRRKIVSVALTSLAGMAATGYFLWPRTSTPAIRLGLIQPFNSPMACPADDVRDTIHLAVNELNSSGGLLGRRVELIEGDSRSTASDALREASRLMQVEKVHALIGGASSIERIALQQMVTQNKHLSFFPAEFEGLDESEYVYHLGGIPNQLHLPVINWWHSEVPRKRYFLIGSGRLYPGTLAELIRPKLAELGAALVGTDFVDVGVPHFEASIAKMRAANADALIVVIRGNEAQGLLNDLDKAKITIEQIPTLWFGISEDLLRGLPHQLKQGHLLGSTYFQSIDCPVNRAFVAQYQAKRSDRSIISATMEGAYTAVHLWAHAVVQAGTADPEHVRPYVRQQTFMAPSGPVKFAEDCNYAYNYARAGRFLADGKIEVVWRSEEPIAPEPFPASQPRSHWHQIRNTQLNAMKAE